LTKEQHSVILHESSVVVDMHSDANLDVIRSRGRGERRVLERRHLPLWKEGGINVVVLDHVDSMLRVAGAGHVGMGPDYADNAHDMIIAARRVAGPNQPVNDVTIPYARGLEHAGKLPDFTRGLVARGYDDATIRGILGESFITLFRKVRDNV
jgi:microsomal dipeptidase-like Zn-dependent dipeptidase